MQVIPTINADSFEEIKRRIKLVEPFSSWVQIDVADGTFTKNTIWHNSADLLSLETSLKIEVHLMINDIEERIDDWLIEPVHRVIFHLEASKNPFFVIKKIRENKKEVGMAIGPDTPWTQLMRFCPEVNKKDEAADLFQVLAVYPGLAGQKFQESSLLKIKDLRNNCPSVKIEVDGGVNKEVGKKCKEVGADILSAASYVFDSDDLGKAIKELENL